MHRTTKIDLTRQTKSWNRIQVIGAVTFFSALDNVATISFDLCKTFITGASLDIGVITLQASLLLFSLFMIKQIWTYSSIITWRSLKKLRTAFGLAAAFFIVYFCGALVMLSTVLVEIQIPKASIKLFLLFGFACFVGFGASMIVIASIRSLQYYAIQPIGKTISQVLDEVNAWQRVAPPDSYAHIRIDQPAGIFWVVLGIFIFFIGAAFGRLAIDFWADNGAKGSPGAMEKISTLIEIAGVFFVLKGRAYFTPRTEAVLAIDNRAPILYLRSFLDENPDIVQWGGFSGSFVDRSFEMKAAKYFTPFGPFVAIGSPKDAVPKLGAMRLLRSDSEWQGEVKSLMHSSKLLLASVGNSNWIKWELDEVVSNSYVKKTLFIFPVTIRRKFGWWRNFGLKKKQTAQMKERIDVMKKVYPPDNCPAYDQLQSGEFVLTQVATHDETFLIVSQKPGTNSLMLSILTGHYLIGQQEAMPVVRVV